MRRLADLWPDAKHVIVEYAEKFPDESVWAEARVNGYVILTKDSDFSDEAAYPGPLPQLVRLKICSSKPE